MIGYHGTSDPNALEITKDGFLLGDGWLGPGVYFFVSGICLCPITNAECWALFSGPKRGWKKWAVIEAEIKVTDILDLTDPENIRDFNEIRESVYAGFTVDPVNPKKENRLDPGIIQMLCASSPVKIEGVLTNAVIGFKRELDNKIRTVIPNTTMICIFDVNGVDQSSVTIKRKGTI